MWFIDWERDDPLNAFVSPPFPTGRHCRRCCRAANCRTSAVSASPTSTDSWRSAAAAWPTCRWCRSIAAWCAPMAASRTTTCTTTWTWRRPPPWRCSSRCTICWRRCWTRTRRRRTWRRPNSAQAATVDRIPLTHTHTHSHTRIQPQSYTPKKSYTNILYYYYANRAGGAYMLCTDAARGSVLLQLCALCACDWYFSWNKL